MSQMSGMRVDSWRRRRPSTTTTTNSSSSNTTSTTITISDKFSFNASSFDLRPFLQRPPRRIRLLLIPLLLVSLLTHSHFTRCLVAGNYTYIEASYDLTILPFTGTNSTIPSGYEPLNTTGSIWLNVFDEFLAYDWCTESSWLANGCANAQWYFSDCIPLPSIFGSFETSCVTVSPTGLICVGEECEYEQGGPWTPAFMSHEQPDLRIPDTALFLTFYNAQTLWNVISCNYTIIYTNQSSSSNSSQPPWILLIRGSFISFFNATHPDSNTTIEWEIQLHSNTSLIIMHLISLVNATVDDLYAPISIGLANIFQPEAVMFINNEFVTNRTFSQTLIWTPYQRQNQACAEGAGECSTCLQLPNCYFCASTSACVDLGTNTTSTSNLISPHCPEDVLSTCPTSLIHSCEYCVLAGNRWCSGEANCFMTLNTTNPLPSFCDTTNQLYDLASPGSWIPYCVGGNESCGQQTCNDFYHIQHSECALLPPHDLQDYPPMYCQCQLGYGHYPGEPPWAGALCNICTTGYYQDPDDGSCTECPNVTPTLIIIFVLVGMVVTFILIKLNSHPLFRRLLVPIQNSIVYFQVVSLLELIDFHWPLSVRKALTAISIMGLNLFHLPSIDCYLTSQQTLTFTLIAPAFIGVLLFISGLIGWMYHRCLVIRNKRTIDEAKQASDKLFVLFVRAVLTFLILFYNYLAWALMNAAIDSNNDWQNLGNEFHQPNDLVLQVIGGIVVYLIGIPLLFWFLVFPRHKPARCCCRCCVRPVRRSDILIPLISKYRPGLCQYWECTFVPLWKILFNAIVVFGSGRNQQIALLSSLLILMIFSYTLIAPYTSVLNNREQSWLMGGSLLILLSGLFFYESEPGDTTGKLILVCLSYFLIIGTMVLMVILMGYVMVVVYRDYQKEQAKSPDCEVQEEVEEQAERDDEDQEDDEPSGYSSLIANDSHLSDGAGLPAAVSHPSSASSIQNL